MEIPFFKKSRAYKNFTIFCPSVLTIVALYMTKFFTMQLGKVNSNPVKAEVFGSDFPFYMSLSPLLWNIFYSRMKFFPVFQWLDDQFLKLVSAIFIKFLFFHQMIFSRYSIFCISVLSSFSTCWPLLWRMIEDKS